MTVNYHKFTITGLSPPNGGAQPPADGAEAGERYGEQHESDSQKRRASAGRLERHVGRQRCGQYGCSSMLSTIALTQM
jgi:hypothetical protein